MPKRNSIKQYGENQFYHVYNRGANKQNIFIDQHDYFYFLSLFKRHLATNGSVTDTYGRTPANYHEEVELIAYCLMPNHYHLLCFLKDPEGLIHLMRSVMTAYTMYFNKKYKRTGGLYEGVFLAVPIRTEMYLWHVSRYIHLNPLDIKQDFLHYPHSSLEYFAGTKHADWLNEERLVQTPKERTEYAEFVADYETMHKDRKFLKPLLAAE